MQEKLVQALRSSVLPGKRLLVAVSGGPDSVALLHALKAFPYNLVAGHVDHRLRKSSGRDAQFVQRLAHQWDIPCRLVRVNVKGYAQRHRMGVEEAARTLRYQALDAMARETHSTAILTAHTADDQSETVLMNFLRGAGPTGLAGMPATRRLKKEATPLLIRPFLKVSKKEILGYLKRHGLRFRRDPTNDSLRFSRNRIRHAVLPYLEKFSSGLSARLVQSADIFRQEEGFWEDRVRQELDKTVRQNGPVFTVVLTRLLGYHKALSRRILRHILPGSSFQDIEQVLQLAQSPQRRDWLELPGSWRVRRHKNKLVMMQNKRNG